MIFTQFYPWVKPTLLPTFTQFYPTGFTQWVKRTMPTLVSDDLSYGFNMVHKNRNIISGKLCFTAVFTMLRNKSTCEKVVLLLLFNVSLL